MNAIPRPVAAVAALGGASATRRTTRATFPSRHCRPLASPSPASTASGMRCV